MIWLLLLALFSYSTAQQPVITRVSGCTDTDTQTFNCPRSRFTLTIHGANLYYGDSSLKDYGLTFNQSTAYYYTATSVTDTMVTFDYQVYYGQFMNSDLITVSLFYQREAYASFTGFAFTAIPPLQLTGISGCPIIDGLSASKCNYLDSLTLIGAGFSAIQAENYQVVFGSSAMFYTPGQVFTVVSDSVIMMNLSATSILMPTEAYNSPISLQIIGNANWNLSVITLAYDSIPSIVVTDILPMNNQGCLPNQINGKTRLTGCYSGRSIVRIMGNYIGADTQVLMGGFVAVSAAASRSNSQYIDVYVPIFDTSADVYYDIQLINAVSNVVLSGAINVVSTPEIAGMNACVKKQNVLGSSFAWKAFCLEGEIFSFSAVNIRGRSTPRVWFGPYECPNARVLDDSRTIQCTVSADPDGAASVQQGLFLSWPDHNSTQVMFELWDHPLAPRITALIGDNCYQSSDLSKPMQCLFDSNSAGRNLSISTSRLPALPASNQWTLNMYFKQGTLIGSARFPQLSVDSTTGVVTAWLQGYFRGALTDAAVYQVTVAAQDLSDDSGSNVLPLVLVSKITYDPPADSSSSSSDQALKTALGVVIPFAFIALVVVGYMYLKRRRSVDDSMMPSDQIDSAAKKRIELA